ncbi:TFIIS helical bundle-like domain-containing protein [Carex littledalei]|uniref:TFIIS helical bundle-like domain-containing protein n=1 Tax=Carex littledalei TaxID=544730 RepID=A0A833R310_9POAL|nr:TFIIS helical bundle-like domain-containing protein [Carex littledalei]
MHGRREGEESKSLSRQHMCPVGIDSDKSTTEKVFPSIAGSSVPSDRSRSLTPSADYFLKDGREIRSGDCALFQAGNAPPFIGLVRWFKPGEKEQFPKLCVSWLYRPSDIKLSKGAQLNAAPNEVFYSFHTDVISSASILHPCKVAFLRKGIELPTGISSFVCRRVYDIENKCLWWLTDKDYINERQEEVDWLLERSGKEMHAAVQSGGRSPKPLNGPSSQQLKSGSDSSQNMGTGSPSFPSSQPKGKKRERNDQITEPANKRELRERSTSMNARSDDADPASFKFDSMKAEITKMTEKGGLVDTDAVDKLVSLIQMDRTERKLDMAARVMLADVIAATNRDECLDRFVQLKGVPVLDDWLQEAQKAGKQSGDSGSPKEGDSSGNKLIEDLLLALLRALDKLPVNLNALRTCNIGKSVNHMKNHKNFDIQRKARNLVDTWKKRVDAEMKNNEGKMAGSGQTVSWQGKQGFLEGPHAGNRRSGSTEPAIRSPASHLVGSKSLPNKAMLTPVASIPSKPQSPLAGAPVYKQTGAGNSSSEPPPVAGEEKSTSSSQSQNNSHSCSSDHAKAVGGGSLWKEDARTSTAGSMHTGKTSGSSSRHRRSANGPGSGSHKESNTGLGKSGSLDRTGALDNTSQSGQASEKPVDTPTTAPDHGNSHNRLILRIINPGRSPARGGTGSSGATSEDSPAAVTDKHENDRKSTDAKEGAATVDEGDRSSAVVEEETGKAAQGLITGCSSSGTEKVARNSFSSMNALVESCVKYSEASTPPQAGDDMGMNLLASVAAGEISKSELISSSRSPAASPELQCEGGHNKGKATGKCDESASTPNEESKTGSPMHQSKVKPEDGDKPPIASVSALKDADSVRKQGGTVTVKQECEKRNTSPVAKEDNKNKFAASEKIEGNSADTDQDRKEKTEKVTTKKETTGDENLPVLKIENKTGSSLEGSRAETKDAESKDGIGTAQGAIEARIKECSSEQINQETTSKAESDIAGRRKETNSVAKSGPDVATMLDFDLNEGVPSEDVQQCEPVTSTAARAFPAGHMPGLSPSPFLPPASASSIHAPITVVAAPAKGPFVPPETLLSRSNKGEMGWKGSAATSAFRPAEPRKVLEMQLGCASDTARASSDNASRHSRPPLEFDLNVADERVIEEEVSQSSAQTTGSSARGFDLDLNRADVFEGQENGLFMSSNNNNNSNNHNIPVRRIEVPLIPLRPSSSGFNNNSDTEANGLRDFDLNNGPGLDEAVSEPVQRAQITRSNVNNNVPFLHPAAGLRMNNAEIGNMSSWFSPGNSYPAVAIPSFLPDRPGEQPQPYPIVAAPQGAQRILGPVPGSGSHPFGAEAYRGPPVLSSSPAAMAFSPAAFPYSGFPFGSAFPLGSAPFAGGSAPNYAESSSAIPSMFPAMPSQLMGPTGASGMSSHYPPPRPYLINLPESSSSSGGGGGHDSSRRWVRQGGSGGGLDLNSGPGGADADAKDDKMGQIPRQILGGVSPQVFAEEQARMFQMASGAALKRKEPEGGWDPERSAYKFSWQ